MPAAPARPDGGARWTRLDEVAAWPTVYPHPFASLGHASVRYTIDVRVDSTARDRYAALLPGTVLPKGTLIAAFHHDPERGQRGPIYVMEKTGSGWEFSIVDADGRVRQRGALELCARCHAEAVADQVFGLPAKDRAAPDARN
jgi:hypothetical protein